MRAAYKGIPAFNGLLIHVAFHVHSLNQIIHREHLKSQVFFTIMENPLKRPKQSAL